MKFKGIHVSYTDEGKGVAVVFLHGFLGNKTLWEGFVKPFPKSQNRIITIDLLGHGNTDCLSYLHTMDEMAEAVYAVISHLKIRKYFLVGHSMGGYVSLALAEKYPDDIRGLCMFHSTAKGDSKEKQKDRDRAIKVVKRNAKIFIDEAIPNLFNTKKKPHVRAIAKARQVALSTSKQGIVAALEGMKQRLEREIVLRFAPYPVLYIIGQDDHILPCNDLKTQALLAENGSYVLLEGVGHMGFLEAKDETVKAVREFVTLVAKH
ncbi:MAG: alpha/beta hydrolase [Flavobacteriales bacterium]|nr:alpha/beta hydrolase [Flavobacteriales bacterium]